MIKVEIFRNLQGNVEGFHVQGHANTGRHGSDIVCAAVSAVTQTAVLGIGRYLGRELELTMASGNLQMKLKTAPDELTRAIFETMIIGLGEIENINPTKVRILAHRR